MVEATGGLARELEVLHLVLADGHDRGLVEEDVGAHEHRVGEEPGRDEVLALALVLELRHAAEIAHRSDGGEVPGELGVLAHVALDEQRRLLGVDAAGDEVEHEVVDVLAELFRVVRQGDGVGVDDAEHRLVRAGLDLLAPRADGPQVVAEVQLSGRLDSGEDTCGAGGNWKRLSRSIVQR